MSKPIPFEWEIISSGTYRAKVIGGWIVRDFDGDDGNAMVFIPDVFHDWKIEVTE